MLGKPIEIFLGYTKFPRFKSRKYSIPLFYQDNDKIQFKDIKISGRSVDSWRKITTPCFLHVA